MEKPNCYNCKHRRDIPGNAHSSCAHPATKSVQDNPLAQLLGLMGGVGQFPTPGLKVVGNQHGIRRGWFSHPLNFDPVWLESCDGFEEKVPA